MFREGQIITNSEESLNIAYPYKTFEHYKTIWSPVEAGILNPFNLPRVPVFFALSIIQFLDLPGFLSQALLFFFVIFASLSGMYLFTNLILHASRSTSVITALIYTFNLFTLAQVFRRLLYSGFFALAYLPIFILLWIKFLEEKKLKWSILLIVTNLCFSIAFGHPAYLMAIWTIAIIFSFYKFFKESHRGKISVVFYSIAGFTALILINLWWLYPFIKSSGSYISEVHGVKNQNFELLKGVSPSFGNFQILLLRQSWWYGLEQHWGWFYTNPVIILISILGLLLMIYGIFSSRKKIPFFGFIIGLLFVGWFVSKGTNKPLGETFFYNLFNLVPATGSLRNSYEKFGLVLIFPYSIFLAYGINSLSEKIKTGKVLICILVFLFCGILTYPFWLDDIYLKSEKVIIPQYYRDANIFLNNQNSGKLIHIPHPMFSNVSYNWGLKGQEPSEFLFDRKSMLSSENIPLKLAFKNGIDKDIVKRMGCLNITNIVLHNESFEEKNQVKISKQQFVNLKDTKLLKNFGNLVIYELNESIVKPQVFKVSLNLKNETFESFCNSGNFSPVNILKSSFDEYEIWVPNSDEDFILVLNENYHPFWKLSVNGKAYEESFKIFEFANGWQIEDKGNLSIKIKFVVWPFD